MDSASIRAAAHSLHAGQTIIIVDDLGTGVASLVVAASLCRPDTLAFLVRHGTGYVRVAMPAERCNTLRLPMLGTDVQEAPSFCVSVDAADGVTTGISAQDRARTIRLLGADHARPTDFTRPGHVVPEQLHQAGVLGRASSADAASDLLRLVGGNRHVALCELVAESDGRNLATASGANDFGKTHGLNVTTVSEIRRYRELFDVPLEHLTSIPMHIASSVFMAHRFRISTSGEFVICLTLGVDQPHIEGRVPVAVHRECVASQTFGSDDCACDHRLTASLARMAEVGRGVVIFGCRTDEHRFLTGAGSRAPLTAEPRQLRPPLDVLHEMAAVFIRDVEEQIVSGEGLGHLVLQRLGIDSQRLELEREHGAVCSVPTSSRRTHDRTQV